MEGECDVKCAEGHVYCGGVCQPGTGIPETGDGIISIYYKTTWKDAYLYGRMNTDTEWNPGFPGTRMKCSHDPTHL